MILAHKRQASDNKPNNAIKKLRMQCLSQDVDFTSVVQMPWDDKKQIICSKDNSTCTRWEMISRQFGSSNPILNCHDLINAIKSYNVIFEKNGSQSPCAWKCPVLQNYLANLGNNERQKFFGEGGTLSTIRNLCLRLDELVPSLEVLRTGYNSSIKLHQLQIASLLANAFLCTFPKSKADCPSINFNTLFECCSGSSMTYNTEKIKCIIHYFNRIQKKQPTGCLSFHRQCIPDHKFPRWDKTRVEFTSLRVDAKGKIEDQEGFLQMDFANKYIGGGVLGRGCVQEEIRFIICPELIAARLFTEKLADNEALFVVGPERYCRYSGYSSTFKFEGDYQDSTQSNENGCKRTCLVVLDALYFHRSSEQFRESKILRELKKAYVGFRPVDDSNPIPLATGNWGCGAFGGDPQLKSLLQFMASSQARRNMLYLTFGDVELKMEIEELYQLLRENSVNVGMLYRIIRLYQREKRKDQTVFQFVKETIQKTQSLDSKAQSPFLSKDNSSAAASSPFDRYSEIRASFAEGSQHLKNTPEDSVYPDMDIDFDAFDEDVKGQLERISNSGGDRDRGSSSPVLYRPAETSDPMSSREESSNPLDVIWYENEVASSRVKIAEGMQMRVGSEDTTSSFRSISDTEDAVKSVRDDGSFPGSNLPTAFGSSRPQHPEETSTTGGQGKKLVQRKITDCFLRK